MGCVRSVKRAFSRLDEELGLVGGAFTPSIVERLSRLGSWLAFGKAAKEAAHFLHITVAEAPVRRQTEASGKAYEQLQKAAVEQVESKGPVVEAVLDKLTETRLLLSVEGALVPLVGGQWVEVKTMVIGTLTATAVAGEQPLVHTEDLSCFSRQTAATTFQRLSLVETQRRGLNTAAAVGAVTDGAEWCQSFITYHRPDAVRIIGTTPFVHAH
ncbi:MAG: hypothetical protein ACYDEO_08480 [Aggregatilineales bacterium]